MNLSPKERQLNSDPLASKLKALIASDPLRLQILQAVKHLELPDSWVAAGFVRNLVWDHIHQLSTSLSDIDIIYFCTEDSSSLRDIELEGQLKNSCPKLPWSVKNQARMHCRNADPAYRNCLDAMSYWPEKQTAIAARLNTNNEVELMHCFSLELLFSGKISHNPKRQQAIFDHRVNSKGWLKTWSQLSVE